MDIHLGKSCLQALELYPRNIGDLRLAEGMKDNDLVDPIHELRPEMGLHLGHHRDLDQRLLFIRVGHLLDHVRAEVGRHHDHGVLEVDRAAMAIRHAPVVEYLQQHIEHVRMRLLDLIEQDHAIGLAAHGFGQVTTLLVADVARWRADKTRDGMALLEFGHIDANEMLLRVEQEFGERLAQLGLAHPGRPEKQERAIGSTGIGET